MERHEVLSGKYLERDPRFLSKARDLPSHWGYQKWHRAYEKEAKKWLVAHPLASEIEFHQYMHGVVQTEDMYRRFGRVNVFLLDQ